MLSASKVNSVKSVSAQRQRYLTGRMIYDASLTIIKELLPEAVRGLNAGEASESA